MSHHADHPVDAIPVFSYAELDRYLGAFAAGALQLVMVVGPPGTGKTRRVRAAVGLSDTPRNRGRGRSGCALYLSGHVSAFGLYRQLWARRGCRTIIDDLDKLYAQPDCVRILKQLCDYASVKRVTWCSQMTGRSRGLPAAFDTASTVMLIANEWKTLNADIRALEDRALVLKFEPSSEEVHAAVGSWFDDQAVYEFIGSLLAYVPRISIRHYLKGRSLRRAGLDDWRSTVVRMLLPDAALAGVLRLQLDRTCSREKERVERFIAETGMSRPTYFRLKRRLQREFDAGARGRTTIAAPGE